MFSTEQQLFGGMSQTFVEEKVKPRVHGIVEDPRSRTAEEHHHRIFRDNDRSRVEKDVAEPETQPNDAALDAKADLSFSLSRRLRVVDF